MDDKEEKRMRRKERGKDGLLVRKDRDEMDHWRGVGLRLEGKRR